MNIITVKNLYKIFGTNAGRTIPMLEDGFSKEEILKKTGCTVAIDDASFQVKEKETFVIMGLSGSGKSTVLRCINRLIEPTRGEVLVGEERVNIMQVNKDRLLDIRRKKMSMVFQNFGLFPHRSVLNNVAYGLEIGGKSSQDRKKKAEEAIELVGLTGYENMKPRELSGGMKQRVGLARALANDPEILLMDEAFSALDPLIRTDMQDELLELQTRMNKTILFITHDLDEALKLGDRIAIMKDGRIVQIGSPEEILTNPATEYVKAFVQNVDRTKIVSAEAILKDAHTITIGKDKSDDILEKMEKYDLSEIFAVDSNRRLKGIITHDDIDELKKSPAKDLASIIISNVGTCLMETPVRQLFPIALESPYPIAVLGKNNEFQGIVDRSSIIDEFMKNHQDTDAVHQSNTTEIKS